MRKSFVVSFLFVAWGCSESPTENRAPEPALLAVVSGDSQSVEVGNPYTVLVVGVTSAGGAAVRGAKVNWTVSGNLALETPDQTTTDHLGLATAQLSPVTVAGSGSITASIGGPVASASFVVTTTAGKPAQLVITSGPGQTGVVGSNLPMQLAVTVSDRYGNGVTGARVRWVVRTADGGFITPHTANTDVKGVSRVTWKLGPQAGNSTAIACLPGSCDEISGRNFTIFAATAEPGPAVALTVDQGNSVLGVGQTFPLTVRPVDQYGNTAVLRTPLTWKSSDDAVAYAAEAGANGVAPGTATITATSGSFSAAGLVTVTAAKTISFALSNQLTYPVKVVSRGRVLATIPRHTTITLSVDDSTAQSIIWSLIRPEWSDQGAIGLLLTGRVAPPTRDALREISNYIDGEYYFVPAISNRTGEPLTAYANMRERWDASLCACGVGVTQGETVSLGYHALNYASTVIAFNPDTEDAYGFYWYETGFEVRITGGSGAVSVPIGH